MQGVSLINDLNGDPAVLTIDIRNLDPSVNPLVAGLTLGSGQNRR